VTPGSPSLLVVATEDERRAVLADALDAEAVAPAALPTTLSGSEHDGVVVASGDVDAIEATVTNARQQAPGTPCVVTAIDGDEAAAAAATRAGAADYVPRDGPAAVEALRERIAAAIEEERVRENALRDLNRAARKMTIAKSESAVCKLAVETAESVLHLPVTAVFLHDESREVLTAAAATDGALDLFGETPNLEPGESLGWETFRSGEPTVVDDLVDVDRLQNPETPVRSELLVPIGEYGVLVSGSTEPRAFDEFDMELSRSLAATTAAALQRTERERSLRGYRTVFETVQDRVYVLDADNRFRLVTEPLCALFGYDREELLGEPISSFVAETDAIEGIRERLEAMTTDPDGDGDEKRAVTVETEVRDADGGTVPVEAEIVPFPSDDETLAGSVGVVRDVSERKRVKRELAAERSRLTRLLESLPDAVAYAQFEDGQPIVQSVNERFEETFGYAEETLVGESLNEFILPPDRRAEGERLDLEAVNGEFPKTEIQRRTADGMRYFLFRGVPIEGSTGSPEGFGIYTDITEQKTRERRLQVLNRVLRHNLHNEMNVVIGNADLIADEVATADLSCLDVDVASRAREIEATATDVAAMGERVRQLQRALDRSGVDGIDVVDLVDSVVDRYRNRPDAAFETDLPPRLSVRAGDLLEVALDDLVGNALEHGFGDETTRVRVTACRDGEWIELSVADDGPGIPDEEIEALSGDADSSQLSHGSGLGLWLVDWLTTSLGGEVRFEADEPRGSVVTLRLPAHDESR
jgi:PAS domain S-box-containing protein